MKTNMTRGELITWLQNWIIVHFDPTTAKDFEVMGRAIQGCALISFNNDGSICNGYGYAKKRETISTMRAENMIDKAIKELEEN